MSKPINETIALCKCRMRGCQETAEVRRQKNHERGARYLVCPVHGVDRTSGKFQQSLDTWIDENTIQPENPEPGPEITQDEPEPGQEHDPEPGRKKPGFWSSAGAQFSEWFGG